MEFDITDIDGYRDIHEELGLEDPDMTRLMDEVDLTITIDPQTGLEMGVFVCPFDGVCTCEYTITDYIRDEEELYLVKSAAAAHLAVLHE